MANLLTALVPLGAILAVFLLFSLHKVEEGHVGCYWRYLLRHYILLPAKAGKVVMPFIQVD